MPPFSFRRRFVPAKRPRARPLSKSRPPGPAVSSPAVSRPALSRPAVSSLFLWPLATGHSPLSGDGRRGDAAPGPKLAAGVQPAERPVGGLALVGAVEGAGDAGGRADAGQRELVDVGGRR